MSDGSDSSQSGNGESSMSSNSLSHSQSHGSRSNSPSSSSSSSSAPSASFSIQTEETPLLSNAPVTPLTPGAALLLMSPGPARFRLYRSRWYILILFSIMALFNNMLCYTFASVHRVSHAYFFGAKGGDLDDNPGFGLASLVSCYFITYIIFSFPTSIYIEKYGFKSGVQCGAWLQAVGCFVRVLATPPIQPDEKERAPHGELGLLLVGQLIVSLGQAFFVNPPPLLAALWFGVDERTFATTIAVNANTLGIAIAYLLGPAIVSTEADLPRYVLVCFLATLVTALATIIYFPEKPETPPSFSQSMDNDEAAKEVEKCVEQHKVTGEGLLASQLHESHFGGEVDDELMHIEKSDDDGKQVAASARVESSSSSDSDSSEPSDVEDADEDFIDYEHGQAGHGHSHAHGHSHSHHSHSHAHSRESSSKKSKKQQSSMKKKKKVEIVRPTRPRRTKSITELALVQHYSSMKDPPCDFVVQETIEKERERTKNSTRILASWNVFKKMFQAGGFVHTLITFGVAEATINGMSAFMNMIVEPWGYRSMKLVGYMVCAFIGMCMVGSAVIGWWVDKSKNFKTWTIVSLFGSAVGLLYLINVGPVAMWHIWVAMLLMGFWVGPIQPLAIETAVEVTHPAPESSVAAVQQVLGNIFSAALFPLMLLLRNPQSHSMTPALYLMFFCLLGAGLGFFTFDGKYRRLNHEVEKGKAHREMHRKKQQELLAARKNEKDALLAKMNQEAAQIGVTISPLKPEPPKSINDL